MKSRLALSVALSAVVLAGATGCTFITPQATTMPYSASDGVNVDGTGPVLVRNAMFIANEDGTEANFVGVLVNNGDRAMSIDITVDGTTVSSSTVPAGARVSYGTSDQDPLAFPSFDAKPGSMVTVVFSSGGESSAPTQVPVLDGTLSEYGDLVPES